MVLVDQGCRVGVDDRGASAMDVDDRGASQTGVDNGGAKFEFLIRRAISLDMASTGNLQYSDPCISSNSNPQRISFDPINCLV